MAWSNGLQLMQGSFYSSGVGNDTPFAEQINALIMAARGNQVISGVGYSIVSSDLSSNVNHVQIASGSVLVAGTVKSVSATNVNLYGAHSALSSGESRYVLIYVDSTGAVQTSNGTIATAGNQEPPEVPEDSVILFLIYLNQADNVLDANDVADMRLNVPKGGYYNGDVHITTYESGSSSYMQAIGLETAPNSGTGNNNAGIFLFENYPNYGGGIANIGARLDAVFPNGLDLTNFTDNAMSLFTFDAGTLYDHMYFPRSNRKSYFRDSFYLLDYADGNAQLLAMDASARTFTVGTTSDPITTVLYGSNIYQYGTGNTFRIFESTDATYGARTSFGQVVTNSKVQFQHQYHVNTPTNGEINWYSTSSFNQFMRKPLNSYAIHNPQDNAGWYTGAGDDLRMYHDGTYSYLLNTTGSLYIRNDSRDIIFGGYGYGFQDMYFTARGIIYIRDQDDGNADLVKIDSGARTFKVGTNSDLMTLYLGDDVTLYRSAADLLKTDDTFEAAEIRVNTRSTAMDPASSTTSGSSNKVLYGPTTILDDGHPVLSVRAVSIADTGMTDPLLTDSITIKVQISVDSGSTWTTIVSDSGVQSSTDLEFSLTPTDYRTQSGQSVQLRIAVDEAGGSIESYDIGTITLGWQVVLDSGA